MTGWTEHRLQELDRFFREWRWAGYRVKPDEWDPEHEWGGHIGTRATREKRIKEILAARRISPEAAERLIATTPPATNEKP